MLQRAGYQHIAQAPWTPQKRWQRVDEARRVGEKISLLVRARPVPLRRVIWSLRAWPERRARLTLPILTQASSGPPSLPRPKGAKGGGAKGLRRDAPKPSLASCRRWRTPLRDHDGQRSDPAAKVSAMPAKHCPPCRRNGVRRRFGIVSVMARNAQHHWLVAEATAGFAKGHDGERSRSTRYPRRSANVHLRMASRPCRCDTALRRLGGA